MPRDLVLGNGSLLVAFDDQYAIRDLTWPHVGQENHVMGRRCRVGLQVDGRTTWLGGDGWDGDLEYLPDTLVGSSTFRSADLGLVVSVRDAVLDTEPVLVRSFEIEDTLGRDRDLVLWCHHDFDILESDAFNAVTWDPTTRALLHHKRDRYFLTRVIASGAVLWSCDARSTKNGRGVAGKIEDGDVCDHNPVSIGSVDGAVGDVARVPAGGRTRVHAWLCVGRSEAQVVRRHGQVAAAGVDALIAESARRDHQRVGRIGADWDGLPGDIATGARRAWLVVSTQSDAGGGISAANDSETLFPGRETYAYLWPRDAALACAALDRAGDHETSRRFFALCPKLLSPDGWLGHRYWADGTPGSSWLARVRDGRPVPPIQEDETSLVLWAAGEHLRRAPDHGFASTFYDGFVRPAADFVAEYRDPDTRLPLPSWDLWEERYGVHSFTVATVIAGLRAAAEIASRLGCEADASRYATAADEVDAAMDRYLFHDGAGRFARSGHRHGDGYHLDTNVDASLCWLLLLAVRTPGDARTRATIEAVRTHLAVGEGIARYQGDPFLRAVDDDDDVPGNPWLLCTLAVAECETLLGEREAALRRIRWVLDHARPSGALPEQIHPRTGAPIGTCPLTWSHAMVISATARLAETP